MASSTPAVGLIVAIGGSSALWREALAALLRTAPGLSVVVVGGGPAEIARLAPEACVVLWEVTADDELSSVTRELRSAGPPQTPILLLGSSTEDASLADILRSGAAGYVTAESTPSELIALLRQAARGEPALSPRLAVRLTVQSAAAAGQPDLANEQPLSEREMEVLRLVTSGATNKQIAQQLYLSVRTVEGHLAKLYGKLGVNSRTEAALVAVRRGWAA